MLGSMSMNKQKINNEAIYDARKLGKGKMVVLGLQHMFAMFGATVVVPLITGLSVSSTLLFAGLGTLLFHLVTKGKVPVLHLHSLQGMQQLHLRVKQIYYHMLVLV